MLTEEQINKLKKGDNLLVEAYFVEKDGYHLKCSLIPPLFYESRAFSVSSDLLHFPSEHGTFSSRRSSAGAETEVPTPKPKYNPCRPYKKGDVARVVERFGRKDIVLTLGELVTVAEDESRTTFVKVKDKNGKDCWIAWCNLELITPVEKLEPYYVAETDVEFQVRMKYEDKDCLISCFRFKNIVEGYKQYYNMLPDMKQARERAEAERDRLNAEYRKEQK